MFKGGSNTESRGLLSVPEAAAFLHLSRSFIYRAVMSGELPSIKAGRARRIPFTSVEEYVTRLLKQEEALLRPLPPGLSSRHKRAKK